MPYTLIHIGNKFAVKSVDTGKLHGWTTESKAKKQLRLLQMLYMKEHKR